MRDAITLGLILLLALVWLGDKNTVTSPLPLPTVDIADYTFSTETVRVITPQPDAAPIAQPVIILATAVPEPTATPAPTRPAVEMLPIGAGPYTLEQMQVCRDVWAQSLQAELTSEQFSYCQGVVSR